mmetsp:Transcript_5736/g.10324  ORF Transcript_5736/g.10324 Transcript_5736/m.10324 type:complete len:267 (+) Transcript_5736:80-880(+)|eukprot:CAMPEP_0201908888 /NCGR_PEP_ID=MMETSP0903-20130614/855_1 /ASSEMBLY_ACC=CAM_ASM_000552 /TAXON_ID=420261 /ORGANISM="Thalassiosira antarctica, Strain CCMP982" /LENGTH=266 /DNA_ID=CAMNT_0048443323 /DNA_START=27 /DNA_END=827 /DNA_ORIENTATION=+
MPQRRSLSSVLLLIAALTNNVHSQQPKSQQPLQPLGDVLHLVLDKDKDQKVTMDEVNSQMTMLEMLFQGGEGAEGEEYRQLLKGVKKAAPKMFQLLDSNGDAKLSKFEMTYMTKFEKSIKKKDGGLRELVRDVFGILDSDGDDQLSANELLEGSKSSDVIAKVTVRLHELFPLRKTPQELEDFVKDTIESIGGVSKESVAKGMAWIDDDGDGYIQRKEVGKYYNIAGTKFLEISKTIKQMGPMMAMFGGMDMGGGGGGGGGFKMDL